MPIMIRNVSGYFCFHFIIAYVYVHMYILCHLLIVCFALKRLHFILCFCGNEKNAGNEWLI